MKLRESPDKYNLLRSGQRVRDALVMLRRNVDKLGLLDEQDTRLLTLTMDNLFGEVLTAVGVIRGLRKEVNNEQRS